AIIGLALADQDPAAVTALLDLRAARFPVMGHAALDPRLDPTLGALDVSALGGAPNDAFEGHAGRYLCSTARVEERSIFVVAHHQAILAIVEREGLGDALDRDCQSPAPFANLPLVRLLELDGRVPEDSERLGHFADLVAALAARHADRGVAGGKPAHRRRDPLDRPHHPRQTTPHP